MNYGEIHDLRQTANFMAADGLWKQETFSSDGDLMCGSQQSQRNFNLWKGDLMAALAQQLWAQKSFVWVGCDNTIYNEEKFVYLTALRSYAILCQTARQLFTHWFIFFGLHNLLLIPSTYSICSSVISIPSRDAMDSLSRYAGRFVSIVSMNLY